jgi:hypothetical protein
MKKTEDAMPISAISDALSRLFYSLQRKLMQSGGLC